MTTASYPLDPVLAALGIHRPPPPPDDATTDQLEQTADRIRKGTLAIANRFAVCESTSRRWWDHGISARPRANQHGQPADPDLIANLLGCHPSHLWPTWATEDFPLDPDLDEGRDDFYTDDPPLGSLPSRARAGARPRPFTLAVVA